MFEVFLAWFDVIKSFSELPYRKDGSLKSKSTKVAKTGFSAFSFHRFYHVTIPKIFLTLIIIVNLVQPKPRLSHLEYPNSAFLP